MGEIHFEETGLKGSLFRLAAFPSMGQERGTRYPIHATNEQKKLYAGRQRVEKCQKGLLSAQFPYDLSSGLASVEA